MQLKKMTIELIVDDVLKTVEFYKNILNFQLINKVMDREKYSWALMNYKNSIEIMFISRNSVLNEVNDYQVKEIGDDFILSIEMNEIKEFYESVKGKANLVKYIENTSYGTTEFAMRDINQTILMFTERNE